MCQQVNVLVRKWINLLSVKLSPDENLQQMSSLHREMWKWFKSSHLPFGKKKGMRT